MTLSLFPSLLSNPILGSVTSLSHTYSLAQIGTLPTLDMAIWVAQKATVHKYSRTNIIRQHLLYNTTRQYLHLANKKLFETIMTSCELLCSSNLMIQAFCTCNRLILPFCVQYQVTAMCQIADHRAQVWSLLHQTPFLWTLHCRQNLQVSWEL